MKVLDFMLLLFFAFCASTGVLRFLGEFFPFFALEITPPPGSKAYSIEDILFRLLWIAFFLSLCWVVMKNMRERRNRKRERAREAQEARQGKSVEPAEQ